MIFKIIYIIIIFNKITFVQLSMRHFLTKSLKFIKSFLNNTFNPQRFTGSIYFRNAKVL